MSSRGRDCRPRELWRLESVRLRCGWPTSWTTALCLSGPLGHFATTQAADRPPSFRALASGGGTDSGATLGRR